MPATSASLQVELVEALEDGRMRLRLSGGRTSGRNDGTYLVEPLPPQPFQLSRWRFAREEGAEPYEVVHSLGRRPLRCSCTGYRFRSRNQALPGTCRHVEALRQLGLV